MDDGELLGTDTPAQVQIYRQLRAEIVDGIWVDRADFPGERELGLRFGVSVVTSRAALDRLAREGLVERRRGRGTRAIHVPSAAADGPPPLFPPRGPSGFSYRVERVGVETAPAEACRCFGVDLGTPMWQAVRVGVVGGEAHAVFHNVQPVALGERHTRADLETKPMVAILAGEGTPIRHVTRRVSATRATPDAARHLGLDLDDPVLLAVLRAEDDAGETVEWTRIFVRPDQRLREEVLDLQDGRWSAPAD